MRLGSGPSRGRWFRSSGGRGTVACLLALVAAGCDLGSGSAPRARDVVLVVVDGLRADHLSLHGYGSATSDSIDRLAADSVVYERASSPATWCTPAQASLLTGRWPSFHGAERIGDGSRTRTHGIDPDAVTLAEVLRGEGFRSVAFVGGDADLAPERGFARGFDEVTVAGPSVDAVAVAGRVSDWLEGHPERAFVFVNLTGPSAGADGRVLSPATAARGGLASGGFAAEVARYDGEVANADRAVGEIVATLRTLGRFDDTLIIVTADHGELLGEHGLRGHGWPPFEPLLHVPLVVKFPGGGRAGERVDRRVSTLGVFATVVEAAGADLPAQVQSRPLDQLHPVWVEEIDPDGRRMRAGYDGPDWKIVRVTAAEGELACVFDLSTDPDERNPICGDGASGPLRLALESFSRRSRPVRGAEDVPAPRAGVLGTGVAQAAR